jgi:hypothetical protein
VGSVNGTLRMRGSSHRASLCEQRVPNAGSVRIPRGRGYVYGVLRPLRDQFTLTTAAGVASLAAR